jgi:uncharacterized repeat protein (TIGR03803 family)
MKWFRATAGFGLFSIFLLATASETSAAGSRLSVLQPFNGANGRFSAASLMRAADGNFYGTTEDGGAFDRGTIFRMTPAGVITVLHSFAGNPDGNAPRAGLIQASDGNFYGTTYFGGGTTVGYGTVFRMTPAGTVSIIHSFGPGDDGENPRAALLQAADGNLWGTTERGGAFERGTVFGMTLAGGTIFRYSFTGANDGAYPYAPLIQARSGAMYGTVYAGDFSTFGRVFRLAFGTVSVVHTFLSSPDGANPTAGLVQGVDGQLYGTTNFGGAVDKGTVFRMTEAGAVTIVHSFDGGPQGGSPHTGLIQPRDGNFYGAAKTGGAGYGTLYKVSPNTGIVTVLHAFTGGSDGATPSATLLEASAGKLYGTTTNGGVGNGVVFRLATDIVGASPGDFDGDGRADQTVFRPSNGTWLTNFASGGTSGLQWGNSADRLVAADYDGDGRTDRAVFRPSSGIWFIVNSGSGAATGVQWGNAADKPVPGDYDGDRIADIAVFRPSDGVWYIRYSSTGTAAGFQWGNAADRPVPADYDGDGLTDIAVFRPSDGVWYVRYSATGATAGFQWGNANDIVVPADYDGDGKADLAVFRPSNGTWYIVRSSTNTAFGIQWGNANDMVVPGDYDGDGRADVAVFRPSNGTWYIVNSTTNSAIGIQWGNAADIPVLRRQ